MKGFRKRAYCLGLVVMMILTMVGTFYAMGSSSEAYEMTDAERRRLLPDPPIEDLRPAVPGQLCKTGIRYQRSNVDYFVYTAVFAGANKHGANDQTYVAGMHHTANMLTDIGALGSSMGDFQLASAAADPNKYVTADVLSIIDLTANQGVGADGKYEATLGIGGINPTDKIIVFHYTNAGWENIIPSAVGFGTVAFKSYSMSPFVVVRLNVVDISPYLQY